MSGGLAKLEKSKIAKPELSSEFDQKIASLKERLGRGQFVCGETYSLADCLYTCTLARLAMLGLLDNLLTERPKLAKWWTAMQARQSFKSAGIVSFGLGQVIIKKMCVIL